MVGEIKLDLWNVPKYHVPSLWWTGLHWPSVTWRHRRDLSVQRPAAASPDPPVTSDVSESEVSVSKVHKQHMPVFNFHYCIFWQTQCVYTSNLNACFECIFHFGVLNKITCMMPFISSIFYWLNFKSNGILNASWVHNKTRSTRKATKR